MIFIGHSDTFPRLLYYMAIGLSMLHTRYRSNRFAGRRV